MWYRDSLCNLLSINELRGGRPRAPLSRLGLGSYDLKGNVVVLVVVR